MYLRGWQGKLLVELVSREKKLGEGLLQRQLCAVPARMKATCPCSSSHGHVRFGSSAATFSRHIGSAARLRLGLQDSRSSRVRLDGNWRLHAAALRPRPPPRRYGAEAHTARTMALQDCISKVARKGGGQSRYPCSAYEMSHHRRHAMVLLDRVSGEAMEGEGQPRSPWVVHPPVTMPGEGPRASKDRCAWSPPHARWNASDKLRTLYRTAVWWLYFFFVYWEFVLIIVNSDRGLQSNACGWFFLKWISSFSLARGYVETFLWYINNDENIAQIIAHPLHVLH